jgi:ATP-dependent DNA helicase RecG
VVKLSDRLDVVLGGKAARNLADAFGMSTVEDLLRHYPRKYNQGMTVLGEDQTPPEEGEHITFVDVIEKAEKRLSKRSPKPMQYLVVSLKNRRPRVTATFFNSKYTQNDLLPGTRLMLSGEVKFYGGAMQLTHPAFLVLDGGRRRLAGSRSLRAIAEASQANDGEVLLSAFEREFFPIYAASAKLQSWDIYACVCQVLNVLDPVVDPLPESVVTERHLVSEDTAIRDIHLAENQARREQARDRFRFDEAVGLQWALAQRRNGALSESGPAAPRLAGGLTDSLLATLPFELTDEQQSVFETVSAELSVTKPMNRLLQGEVGAGKTIVAVLAMLQMVDSGYQCALLAPTEVLAAQHVQSIRSVLGALAMGGQLGGDERATRIALLTGSMSAAQKRQARNEVASGEAGIVVGTHALIQDDVEFHKLGLVVVDEQHRFGVEQRDRLRAKAPEGLTPHLLVLTATPIPRTVALTVFGDLETSTMRQLPRGRQPITTKTLFINAKPQWLDRAWARITEEVRAGRQAYVVASRIDENDGPASDENSFQPMTVVELHARLAKGPLAGLRIGLMHGRLSSDEKDAVMANFRAGNIDVLVCTTVIEVGIDVPNATVMFIMDADRFGISQLHQLRGRIGRGVHPSLCILATQMPEASKAGARLTAVAGTLDGFALADLDLQERGEGDVLGLNQSGRPITLHFLSLAEHLDIILDARELCAEIYDQNPNHEGMATLASRFTTGDRIDYLDKA